MTIDHPYQNLTGGKWLRGNLHAHTTMSDGRRSRQEVVDDYAARGYDFLMLSDHDVFTGEAEYQLLNTHGMAMIPGNEVTANGPHMLHVNATGRVEPHINRQQVLDEGLAAGGFFVLNHPNWKSDFNHYPVDLMASLRGHVGMEIYNGVIGCLDGSPYACDKWDMLLSAGHRVWGFANDDSHFTTADCGLGWNCAHAHERSASAITAALAAGRFYASTGVAITNIQVSGNRIRVETENADRIVAHQKFGKRLKVQDGTSIEVEVPESAGYVRFECWGRGEQFAWTQPFWVNA